MRKFKVYVTGIAAFVEDYRRVVAINASHPQVLTITENGVPRQVTIPAHFPYIRVPEKQVDDDTAQRMPHFQDWNVVAAKGALPPDDDHSLQSATIRQTLMKFLHGQEVVLPDSPTPLSNDEAALGTSPTPSNGNKNSVLWLPSLQSLGAKATKIDQKHIVKNPDPNVVAAYIRFPKGRMTTAVASDFQFVSVSLDGSTLAPLNRVVAQLLLCEMDVPDTPFTVICRSYNGDSDFPITFKAGVQQPWMVFACTSLEDALQLPAVEEKFGIDFHFRLIYGLLEGNVKDGDIALPKSILPAPGAKPLGAGKCIPPHVGGGATAGA